MILETWCHQYDVSHINVQHKIHGIWCVAYSRSYLVCSISSVSYITRSMSAQQIVHIIETCGGQYVVYGLWSMAFSMQSIKLSAEAVDTTER